MRRLSVCLLALSAAGGLFAYWGMITLGGSQAFDEMAGMIPFLIGLSSGVLFLAGAVTWWLAPRYRNGTTHTQG